MNIILIISDQHNPEYIGLNNDFTRTPHINKLINEGVSFKSAYSQSPICSSTRAAMITGKYVHETKVWDNAFAYDGKIMNYGKHFINNNISFTTIGKLDFLPNQTYGFTNEIIPKHRENIDITSLYRNNEIIPRYDSYFKHKQTGFHKNLEYYESDFNIVNVAKEWIIKNHNSNKQWIIVINLNDLHRPWKPTKDIWDYYLKKLDNFDFDSRFTEKFSKLHPFHQKLVKHHCYTLLNSDDYKKAFIGYNASCEILDMHVGNLYKLYKKLNLTKDTYLIYTSDHGGMAGEHLFLDHGALYEGSIKIPLVFNGPGMKSNIINENVSKLDVYPTICELLNIGDLEKTNGQSLYKSIKQGNLKFLKNKVYCEYHGAGTNNSGFVLKDKNYKYIYIPNEGDMVFNLESDPHELSDLSKDNNFNKIRNKLKNELLNKIDVHKINESVFEDQLKKKIELKKNGMLEKGLKKRGYEFDYKKLIVRKEIHKKYVSMNKPR